MTFRSSAASELEHCHMEAMADIDEAIHCLACLKPRRACRCLVKARHELRTANQLLRTSTTA